MNPFDLDASGLMIWGLVAHLVADWPLQNDWMANNKAARRQRHNPTTMTGERGTPYTVWWDRHPAAYVHALVHLWLLLLVFGWVAFPLAVVHLLIDTRKPVIWWSKFIGQTQPKGESAVTFRREGHTMTGPLYDVGTEVRFWTDQVFHIICIAVAALVIG